MASELGLTVHCIPPSKGQRQIHICAMSLLHILCMTATVQILVEKQVKIICKTLVSPSYLSSLLPLLKLWQKWACCIQYREVSDGPSISLPFCSGLASASSRIGRGWGGCQGEDRIWHAHCLWSHLSHSPQYQIESILNCKKFKKMCYGLILQNKIYY